MSADSPAVLNNASGHSPIKRNNSMARVVIASNRVPVPSAKGPQAGGLAVVLKDIVKPGTVWFGWSGRTAHESSEDTEIVTHDAVTYATIDLKEETYRSF